MTTSWKRAPELIRLYLLLSIYIVYVAIDSRKLIIFQRESHRRVQDFISSHRPFSEEVVDYYDCYGKNIQPELKLYGIKIANHLRLWLFLGRGEIIRRDADFYDSPVPVYANRAENNNIFIMLIAGPRH